MLKIKPNNSPTIENSTEKLVTKKNEFIPLSYIVYTLFCPGLMTFFAVKYNLANYNWSICEINVMWWIHFRIQTIEHLNQNGLY